MIVNTTHHFTYLLLDSGAIHGDYISKDLAQWIFLSDCNKCKGKKSKVRGVIGDRIENIEQQCEVKIVFMNEKTKSNETITKHASVVDIKYPIIVGR